MDVKGCCPLDCQDSCAWVARVEDGRVVRVEGAKDHPITRGVLCAKVRDYEARLTAPDRLLHPLRRTGPKGSGQFTRITWDEALAEIASRFRAIIAEYGGEALLPFCYLGSMGAVQRFAPMRIFNALGSSRTQGGVCSASASALGREGHPVALDPTEASDARLIVLWGQNVLTTSHHHWHFIAEARKKGARIIAIDPRVTRTTKQCDLHLAPVPGSDAVLAAAVGRHLLATGRADRELAEMWVADLADYEKAVAPWTFDKAAAATGLAADAIAGFAEDFAAAKPALIRGGVGLQQSANGETVVRALSALTILGGHWRQRGGGLFFFSFPDYDEGLAERADLRPSPARKVPGARLAEVLTDQTLAPPIKGFMVWSANPAATQIDGRRMAQGLLREDLFTVVADHFLSDTARFADIVLPATTQLEHLDVQGAWGHDYVLANMPAVPPMGEARSSGAIMRGLAEKLGLDHPALREGDAEIAAATMPEGWSLAELQAAGWRRTPQKRPAIVAREEKLRISDGPISAPPPLSAQHLQLLTPKGHFFLNTTFANMARQRQSEGEPTLQMNAADATARGLTGGANVVVRAGSRRVGVKLSVGTTVRPGVVALEGKWWNADFPVNGLSPSRWSPANEPAYNDVFVTVEAG
jgi:anaerobic selenocysteine-containing dehydrogenase